jgi:hypothetical protein
MSEFRKGFWRERNTPLGCHILNFDASDPNFSTGHLDILDGTVFFWVASHLDLHDSGSVVYETVQGNTCPRSRAHALHHTKVDVFQFFRPWQPHQFENFEVLKEMVVLL